MKRPRALTATYRCRQRGLAQRSQHQRNCPAASAKSPRLVASCLKPARTGQPAARAGGARPCRSDDPTAARAPRAGTARTAPCCPARIGDASSAAGRASRPARGGGARSRRENQKPSAPRRSRSKARRRGARRAASAVRVCCPATPWAPRPLRSGSHADLRRRPRTALPCS